MYATKPEQWNVCGLITGSLPISSRLNQEKWKPQNQV